MPELSVTLERALAALGDQAVMSPDARRRGPKFPAGGERIAELLLQIAEQHGVFLPPSMKIEPDMIRRRLRDAAVLRPVVARATLVNAALTDRARTNEREAWQPTLALYRLLQTLAVGDNALAVSLVPVQELFSRPRKAKAVRPSPAVKEVKIDKTGLRIRKFEEAPSAPEGAYRARRERAFVFPWPNLVRALSQQPAVVPKPAAPRWSSSPQLPDAAMPHIVRRARHPGHLPERGGTERGPPARGLRAQCGVVSAETTSEPRPDEADEETDASLALSPWGQRFLTPETEGAYRTWYARRSVPLVRGAGVASAIAWALVLIPTWFAGRVPPALPVCWVLFVIYPSIAAVWWTTLRPHRLAWLSPSMMVATSLSGFTAVGLAWLSRMEAVSLAGVVVSAYFATASVRLRPEQAAAAVVPYVVLHQVWMVLAYRSGTLDAAECAMYSGMPWVTLQIAVYSAIGLERGSREAFRQERVIEAQKRTIARERARSEALLKQELGHQVAARSRELGQILATSESSFIVGSLSPGDRFDTRYVVERALGAGGMGAVFEVRRITDGQRLALKIVTGLVTGAQAARFAREAEIGARVHHPHVVSIVDVGIAPGRVPFLVMELAEGGALEDERARFGDARWALPILRQIAEGLAALHQAGVVHRDLKPANVLFVGSASQQVAKISDFGISRFGGGDTDAAVDALGPTVAPGARAGLTATGTILGTPLYMAPESLRGGKAVDAPADVFAFGIIAFEMLTGKPPFVAPPVYLAMAGAGLSVPTLEVADLAPPAIMLLERCLATAPEDRPAMRSICDALRGDTAFER